jgi:hypothetical protein
MENPMIVPWNIQDSSPDGMVFKYHKRFDVSHIHVGDFMPGDYNGCSYYVSSISETSLYTHIHMEKVV